MRFHTSVILLALAGTVQAADTVSFGHRVIPDNGEPVAKPMSWRYGMLRTAQALFDEGAPRQAPGATLSFRLPRLDAAQGDNHVEIIQGDKRTALPMTSPTTFGFVRDDAVPADAAVTVVNRHFPPGAVNHPNVRVRSPGLPDGVRRMGDLRLACAAQIAMMKTEGMQLRAMFGVAGLFGLNVCSELEVTKADPPAGKYDTVMLEDGERRLAWQASQANPPRIGDKGWSDDTRIRYTLDGIGVQ
ncbi:hypothetical protein GJV26_18835 [Massilia dura]|uniref:Uncharacterized protein n=1 Tax=Pseudoduganella dura TaxID=321982 RepID=A0A6I3XDL7_9BURK|nr:hypothetical protein [Pseudoduganella dura]MUI14497.1 hypothetical protein [Pseudoduganella dura]GGY13851.1 hypothetical protein GCM10007386_50070 [Pseudoduganella dura]